MKNQKRFGLFLTIVGILIILSSVSGITGSVISNETLAKSVSTIIGLVLVIGGLGLFIQENVSPLELKVYDTANGKSKYFENTYFMSDLGLAISKSGRVSLGEFRHAIDEVEGDKELLDFYQKEFGIGLQDIRDEGNSLEKNIAKEFLDILYHGEVPSEMEESEEVKEYISSAERKEIKDAFKGGWKNAPNNKQSAVLKKYNLEFDGKDRAHPKISHQNDSRIKITVSKTPSSHRVGRDIAGDLIDMVIKYNQQNEESN